MKKRLLVLAAILAASTTVVSAQKLVVYSSVDEENAQAILGAFTQATGIEVSMTHLSSGPALSRIEAESNRPQADVWFGAPNENHILAKSRGLTQIYASPNADALGDDFKDADSYWHAIYTNPMAVGVRTDILESRGAPLPSTWADLLDPAYAGLIQLPSPQSAGTGYNVVLTLREVFGEDEAFEYMRKLDANVQTYTQSGTAPAAALGIGETPIGIQFSPGILQLIDEGFPIQIVFPAEGVGYEVPAISILEGANNLDEARQLVDWIISEEGQQSLVDNKTYFLPIRPGIDAGEGVPSLDTITLLDFDGEYASDNRERLVDRWVEEVLGQ